MANVALDWPELQGYELMPIPEKRAKARRIAELPTQAERHAAIDQLYSEHQQLTADSISMLAKQIFKERKR